MERILNNNLFRTPEYFKESYKGVLNKTPTPTSIDSKILPSCINSFNIKTLTPYNKASRTPNSPNFGNTSHSRLVNVKFIKNNFDLEIDQHNAPRKMTTTQRSINKTISLNPVSYVCLKLRNFFSTSKNEVIDNLKYSEKLKRRILNELTIYTMFFEIEKIKKIIFDPEQLKAFYNIKLDFGGLFEKNYSRGISDKILEEYGRSQDRLERRMAVLLKGSKF